MKPITPKEIEAAFPDYVIEAFNNCIQRNFRNGYSSFLRKEIEAEIIALAEKRNFTQNITSAEISKRKYLDVESVYIASGWEVEYHSPDRGESFDSYFKFKAKK